MVSKPEALPMEAALCEDGAAQGRIGSEPVSLFSELSCEDDLEATLFVLDVKKAVDKGRFLKPKPRQADRGQIPAPFSDFY